MKKLLILFLLIVVSLDYEVNVRVTEACTNIGLDTSFNGTGVLFFPPSGAGFTQDSITGIRTQSSGKIILTGMRGNSSRDTVVAIRLHPNGSLDTSFGTSGTGREFYPLGTNELVTDMSLQSGNDKIIISGTQSRNAPMLIRLTEDGLLDSTFNGNGLVTVGAGSRGVALNFVSANRVLLLSDIGGDTTVHSFKGDGTSDTSYTGTNGISPCAINGQSSINSLAVDKTTGQIYTGGYATDSGVFKAYFFRRQVNGNHDSTYGGGCVKFSMTAGINTFLQQHGIVIQSTGKVVIFGTHSIGADNDFFLARFDTNGNLDTSFGSSGKVSFSLTTGSDYGEDLQVQSDDKLVIMGKSESSFVLCRFTSDGEFDSSFGTNGKYFIPSNAIVAGIDLTPRALRINSLGTEIYASTQTRQAALDGVMILRFVCVTGSPTTSTPTTLSPSTSSPNTQTPTTSTPTTSAPASASTSTTTIITSTSVIGSLLFVLVAATIIAKRIRLGKSSRIIAPKYLTFLSHYQAEAGESARIIRTEMVKHLRKGEDVFLDVDHLENLNSLSKNVSLSESLVILLTPNYFCRPYCLLEVKAAIDNDVPIIPVVLLKRDNPYSFLDTSDFLQHLTAESIDTRYAKLENNKPNLKNPSEVLRSAGITDLAEFGRRLNDAITPVLPKEIETIKGARLLEAQIVEVLEAVRKAIHSKTTTSKELTMNLQP